jgi:hypothetical protein
MKSYQEIIKERLTFYKENVLGIKEQGIWKNNGKPYSHILPEQQCMKNLIDAGFHDELCSMALYLGDKLHSGFHHLTSSQALAINLFGPMKVANDFSLICDKNKVNLGIKNADTCKFEHAETDSTNFDFYIELDTRRKFYFEVKYSEATIATKSGSKHNDERWKEYFKAPMNTILKDSTDAYKLFFSQYQLWRNIIRVANDDSVTAFVFLATRKNLESEVQGASDKVKPEYANRIKIIHIDDICTRGEQDSRFSKHYAEFRRKYIFPLE